MLRIESCEQPDHGARCRRIGPAADRGSPLPVDDDALHRRPGVVAWAARGVATIGPWNHDAPAVGAQGNLVGIEAHPACGIERALDLIAVQLAGPYARHEHMPVAVRAVGRWIEVNHAGGPGVVGAIEQQQPDPGCVSREDTEVDAVGEGVAPRGELPPSSKPSLTACPAAPWWTPRPGRVRSRTSSEVL